MAPGLFLRSHTNPKTRQLFNDANFDDFADTAARNLDRHLVSPFVFVYFFGGAEFSTPGSRIDSNFIELTGDWLAH